MDAALASAQQSEFDCHECDAPHSYSLVYVFKQSNEGDCCNAYSLSPTIQQGGESKNAAGQEQSEITIVAHALCICDPASKIRRVRSPKCLYLWKCSAEER